MSQDLKALQEPTKTNTLHLWEVKHPYHCNPQYVSNWNTWKDFLAEFGDSDPDYNLVFRWDWLKAGNLHGLTHDEVHIHMVAQRKGFVFTAKTKVSSEDEASVIEWLKPRLEYLKSLQLPIGL